MTEHERVEQREKLQASGRQRMEGLAQQAADTGLSRMKDRSVLSQAMLSCTAFPDGMV